MTLYEGGRGLAGAEVTADGVPLDPRFDLARLSPAGFEWTYAGAGPKQLALALLAHALQDDGEAMRLADAFMREVVAELDNAWELTGDALRAWAKGR